MTGANAVLSRCVTNIAIAVLSARSTHSCAGIGLIVDGGRPCKKRQEIKTVPASTINDEDRMKYTA
jgi:hypothetical protein